VKTPRPTFSSLEFFRVKPTAPRMRLRPRRKATSGISDGDPFDVVIVGSGEVE
jgi:hypothetical protein